MIKKLIAGLTLTITVFLSSVYFSAVQANSWQKIKSQDGITVYTRAVEGSRIRAFMGEAILDATPETIIAVLSDVDALPEWVHESKDAVRVAENGFRDTVIFQTTNMPFPVTDRDLLIRSVLQENKIAQGERTYTLTMNAVPDYCKAHNKLPVCRRVQQSPNVLIRQSSGQYHITPIGGKRVKLVWQQHTEPGGSLPGWLVNELLVDIPFQTFSAVRKQIVLLKYKGKRFQRDANGDIIGLQ